jgi:hypothetical protein
MQYISLFCALIILQVACDDDVNPSRSTIDKLDQDIMVDAERSSDMSSDSRLDLGPPKDVGLLDPDMSDMMSDMEPLPLDEGIDMLVEDMTILSDLGDLAVEDQGVEFDMEMLEPDMILDMESSPPGLQIRETCESSDECAEGLSCLGWPTGSFCTPTCGYNPPASGRPSIPDCPPGFALECHVSNNCIPARCTNDCDAGYICDESNRCGSYE